MKNWIVSNIGIRLLNYMFSILIIIYSIVAFVIGIFFKEKNKLLIFLSLAPIFFFIFLKFIKKLEEDEEKKLR